MKNKNIFLKIIILLTSFFSSFIGVSQNVGINSTGAIPAPSALLDIDASPANNKGFAKHNE